MASVTVNFDTNPGSDDILTGGEISIFIGNGGINPSYGIIELLARSRTQNNEFTLGGTNQGSALNFLNAVRFDYGNTAGVEEVEFVSPASVRIVLADGWTTSSASADGFIIGQISFTIDNTQVTPPVPDLEVSTDFTERALDPCNTITIDFTITGGQSPFSTTVDGFTIANTGSSPSVPKQRGVGVSYSVSDSSGQTVSGSLFTPVVLVASNFSINITQSLTGSTVEIVNASTLGLGLTYSLDNVTFFNTNSFSGQAPGDYTAYIKDVYGCTVSLDYTIPDITPVSLDPFFLFPEANMVRMYQVQDDTESIRANYYNRQSCQEYVRGWAYQNIQYWEPNDDVYIQLKTNHDNVQLFSVDPEGNESSLGIIRVVQNIGLQDGRDGKYFRLTNDTLGLYFDSGNTYDPDTFVITGTYALTSGLLPSFITEGVFVNIVGLGFKEVLSTGYDQSRERWYAVISGSTSITTDIQTQVYTNYNNQNYDVYATTIPMSSRLNTNFKFKITTALTEYLSEEQQVISSVRGPVIDYYNTENRYDVVYALDPPPRFRLRMPDMDFRALIPDSRVQNYESDNAPIQLDNKLYKNFELRCEDLSTAMAFKVLLALTHNAVTVNGLTLTFKEVGEFENRENTNLYDIRIIMIEGGDAAARQREDTINLTTADAIRLEADLGLINYNA